uniref:ribosomal protein L16 n=1 Tax=Rhynchospora tenuis TaxID=198213 RepID=UPI002238DE94|nr:ribosomal protein L16 [Rhynchospora tenuis]UYP50842.1 ribosomal protein L16 [Rhynchospora tenuis]
MNGKFRRNGKIWVRLLADLPITGKPTEVRMGRGKGNPTGWIARVSKCGSNIVKKTGMRFIRDVRNLVNIYGIAAWVIGFLILTRKSFGATFKKFKKTASVFSFLDVRLALFERWLRKPQPLGFLRILFSFLKRWLLSYLFSAICGGFCHPPMGTTFFPPLWVIQPPGDDFPPRPTNPEDFFIDPGEGSSTPPGTPPAEADAEAPLTQPPTGVEVIYLDPEDEGAPSSSGVGGDTPRRSHATERVEDPIITNAAPTRASRIRLTKAELEHMDRAFAAGKRRRAEHNIREYIQGLDNPNDPAVFRQTALEIHGIPGLYTELHAMCGLTAPTSQEGDRDRLEKWFRLILLSQGKEDTLLNLKVLQLDLADKETRRRIFEDFLASPLYKEAKRFPKRARRY